VSWDILRPFLLSWLLIPSNRAKSQWVYVSLALWHLETIHVNSHIPFTDCKKIEIMNVPLNLRHSKDAGLVWMFFLCMNMPSALAPECPTDVWTLKVYGSPNVLLLLGYCQKLYSLNVQIALWTFNTSHGDTTQGFSSYIMSFSLDFGTGLLFQPHTLSMSILTACLWNDGRLLDCTMIEFC
jgi:hypothetical protein